MKLSNLFYTGLLAVVVLVSCQKQDNKQNETIAQKEEKGEQNKKRKPLDFSPVKVELNLSADKEKLFDEIIVKYQKLRDESFQAAKQGDKLDRMTLGIKNEELTKQQAEEMQKVLTPVQMQVFNKFVDENSRKRPRYNDELLAKIQKEIGLSPEQMKVVNAANDAFEKSFYDAHDVYHGNNDLAKEYWEKFDAQRREVILKALNTEQFAKFQELTKEVKFMPRKKK